MKLGCGAEILKDGKWFTCGQGSEVIDELQLCEQCKEGSEK